MKSSSAERAKIFCEDGLMPLAYDDSDAARDRKEYERIFCCCKRYD